jgi:hypothetical protein
VARGGRQLRDEAVGLDEHRNVVCAFAACSGTHSGEGGPMPPTGKSTRTDYVYVMDVEDARIKHMTKIWNAGWAMKITRLGLMRSNRRERENQPGGQGNRSSQTGASRAPAAA